MAEETKKTYTDIEKADAFYDAVMKYKEKIEKTESGLATFEKSGKYKEYDAQEAKAMEALEGLGALSDVQKDMVAANKEVSLEHDAREKLLAQKEKYLESVSALEGQIRIAISKYIVDTEKEQKKLEKDKEKYAEYVEKEKAEYEELKAKVDAMDKDDVTYEDEVAKLENKKNEIENMDKKLTSFDERLAKVTDELNKNKEKYKDYIDLAKEELPALEEPEEKKDTVEKPSEEIPEAETKKDIEEKDEELGEVEDIEEVEGEEIEKEVETKPIVKAKKTKTSENPGVVYGVPEDINDSKTEDAKVEAKKETDKQAFKRIYKSIKNKETLSIEDTDKMIALLGEKANFTKLGIGTKRFWFFKSKGEKVFTGLGKQLTKQIRGVVKDEALLKKLRTKDIRVWERIIKLGCDKPANNIVEILNEVAQGANKEEVEKIKATKERFERFSNSAKVLYAVKAEREGINVLPPSHEEKSHESEIETVDKSKGLDELSTMVKSEAEIAEKDVIVATETPKKAVEKATEEKTI